MNSGSLQGWQGYAISAGMTFAALLITLSLQPLVLLNNFNLFQGAVFLSVWFSGLGPGLLSSVLSILVIDYFFMTPSHKIGFAWTDGTLNLAIFAGVALLTSSLSARLKRAKVETEMARAQLEERLEERTHELLRISHHEQQRLGQDLHDGLCQTLAGVKLLLEALEVHARQAGRPEAEEIEKIEKRVREALAQADAISRGLYPVELETNGLMAALQEMAFKTSRIYPVSCRFVCRQSVLIEDHARATHLYRIAQECVMNAIKSGKAEQIQVRLFMRAGKVHLVVADDGIGFHGAPARAGMGLQIMKYRAQSMHAALKIRQRRIGGTLVSCAG